MAAQFRSNLWDPVLIVSQIIAIQCTYYVGLGVWILIFDFWMGSVHSLHQVFSDKVRKLYCILSFVSINRSFISRNTLPKFIEL